ncbi:vacuolar protein sorting-associated protein VTA1 [Cryptococcus deuterogattii 99/473]|uniref:Vacuolar protein sorting-associated protein VTA1 n=1 Tax=Cryptococcus deuterogattii Ram5 TaxID=1296110 RepID=A0A0D0UYT0_9TREE|nr:vacuolar protein sorting-associated protein VTA1 [Cryptococcus deuterogattii Ram5]KIY58682.1 vacuolar protein sorting-associated protein VTA1 [Cryptococcus deuterogattii 99/473]
MQNVNIPADSVPQGLKHIEQILKRAKELKQAEPIVAYWCSFSAAQKALNVQNRTKEDTLFLMSLIDALEQMKVIMGNNEAIHSEAAGAAYIENFALKVFMSADNDDRAGNTGKATIRKFVVAGQFIEILRCFEHGMTEEQKLQYARWKAADGAKALREGRTPKPGPPIPEDEALLPAPPAGSPDALSHDLQLPSNALGGSRSGSFSSAVRTTVPSPPIMSPRPSPSLNPRNHDDVNASPIDTSTADRVRTAEGQNSGSGAWSTVATPGLPDDENAQAHFDLGRTEIPSSDTLGRPPEERLSSDEKKSVKFMGPDGAPLSPASTHNTVSSYDAPPPPPPTHIASSVVPSKPLASARSVPVVGNPPDGRPRGDSSASTRSNDRHNQPGTDISEVSERDAVLGTTSPKPKAAPTSSSDTRTSTVPSSINVPPAPPPSLASAPSLPPPLQPQSHGLGLTSPPISLAPTPKSLSSRDVEQTQKHAKWAISG